MFLLGYIQYSDTWRTVIKGTKRVTNIFRKQWCRSMEKSFCINQNVSEDIYIYNTLYFDLVIRNKAVEISDCILMNYIDLYLDYPIKQY